MKIDGTRAHDRTTELVLAYHAFFELRDDLIARVTHYCNLEDWLAQVR